ncbi:MAG: hypothetical protein KKA63_10715 [Gammaproteobacteria bacterium]|nr:hypothetical protein [Gammaproteobacteria bacterium]
MSEYFSSTKSMYWPTEFIDIAHMLKGADPNGNPSHAAMYKFNTGVVVLAAIIGLIHDRKREVGSQKQEISTETFESHKFGNCSLAAYIYLVPLLALQDIELLRSENEEEVIRIFEKYVAGGFEYLRGALSQSSDITGQTVLNQEVKNVFAAIDGDEGMIDIMSIKA